MKFGDFYELQLPRPWTADAEYTLIQNALEQASLADRLGYHYLWATEHHFLEEYSHSSAPEVFLAACSQRTRQIRIGHGIVQMPSPVNHPARVAERIAMLDVVSGGRCEFGSGAGTAEAELGAFGVTQEEKKAMWRESLEVTLRLLVEDPFTGHEGPYVKMPARNLLPKPRQKPHPPLWMACSTRESMLQAARLGLGALTFSFVSAEEARQWVADYYTVMENECVPIGSAVNPNVAITCPFLCDADEARLKKTAALNYGFFRYALGHYGFFGEHRPGHSDIWREYTTNPRPFELPDGRTLNCIGTPEKLRARLEAFEAAGVDQVVCLGQAGRIPHDLLCSSMELFSREVLPAFQDRDQQAEPARTNRRARIEEKALARKPKAGPATGEVVIRAAGHP